MTFHSHPLVSSPSNSHVLSLFSSWKSLFWMALNLSENYHSFKYQLQSFFDHKVFSMYSDHSDYSFLQSNSTFKQVSSPLIVLISLRANEWPPLHLRAVCGDWIRWYTQLFLVTVHNYQTVIATALGKSDIMEACIDIEKRVLRFCQYWVPTSFNFLSLSNGNNNSYLIELWWRSTKRI